MRCLKLVYYSDYLGKIGKNQKSGLEQQGQTILNFHFLIVTLMTGTLYQTPLCLLPA